MKDAWPTTLCLEVEVMGGYPCIRLNGEGECAGARVLGRTIEEIIGRGLMRILLDTRRVRFLDPRCYEVLHGVIRRLNREGGMLVVVDGSMPVERTLKLLGLEQLVCVVPTIKQAIAFLDSHE